MEQKEPRDYYQGPEEGPEAVGKASPFLSSIAGPLIVAVLVALVGAVISGRGDDVRHDERIGVLAGLVNELASKVNENTEFRLKGDVKAIQTTYDLKFREIDRIITDIRIQIARLKEN